MLSNTRLYGASIAFVSGGYSLWSASMASRMTATGWLMGVLGVVVIVHGAVLLTSFAARLGDASGPLMIAYSIVMLANQAWMGTMSGGPMGDGMMGRGMAPGMGPGWDAGMVALAILMLVSGAIMTARQEMM
jgi:hypothetical protein